MAVFNARLPTREIKMTRLASVVVLAGFAFIGAPASVAAESQDKPAAAEEGGRYTFHRLGDKFIRLDAQTGHVAQCGWSVPGWSCTAVPDERAALESEIARLQKENVALKRSLLAHGIDLPGEVKPEVAERKDEPRKEPEASTAPKMPSEAELDRAFEFMKKVWRRLVEMMVELQRDIQKKS